jgi:hypothetical protein
MSTAKRLLAALLVCVAGLSVPPLRAGDRDLLDDVKARMKIEAQRVEKEFADGRVAAYRLVRNASPRLLEATEKLQTLLAMVRNDTSLDPKRREVLIVTLRWDLDKVKEIAAENRRLTLSPSGPIAGATRQEARRVDEGRRAETGRRVGDDARSVIESRSRALADARGDRGRYNDRFNKVMRSVDESAIPENRDLRFPKNWKELSMRRSTGQKMTEKEKAIMAALSSVIDVDFNKSTFEEVISYFRKALKVDIAVDKRALEEAGVTYDGSQVTMDRRGTVRSLLKRILADLNLAYVIKDEAILITSRERASQMTTARAYYVGDLAAVVDVRLPPFLTQLIALENANRMMVMITQTIEPQSWKVNNPDAVGEIAFDPVRMSIVVKQTAEVHFMMGGGYGR